MGWDGTVVEASIAELREALDSGTVTSVELVVRYLDRIGAYDRSGIVLNSVPVLNPDVLVEARASDERRSRGVRLSRLDGIPYTAKDSFKVRGMTVAAGSPAFAELIANDDAFTISCLREAGAILLGRTNMPPMANGGTQRGLYGRSESAYTPSYMCSAYGSGSSSGSGTATAASFAAFGLGEETWSSGRAPASNNSLVAYTPSRGIISVRGNWPLVPTMDVIVPHARSVDDLLEVLDVIVVEDESVRGDLWRMQDVVELPTLSEHRPKSYCDIEPANLRGLRFGIPRIYTNGEPTNANPIETRPSVLHQWQKVRESLEACGVEVVETSFPVVENYERLNEGSLSMVDRGIVPTGFEQHEIMDLSIWAWDEFLRTNGQEGLEKLTQVTPEILAPSPVGSLPDRFGEHDYALSDLIIKASQGVRAWNEIPDIREGMVGLERTRRLDFEDWLNDKGLDAVIFPAAADVAPADSDVNPESADIAWRNGVSVSNGNLVPRHLGIPTVTLPMGMMADTQMPVGMTIAGPAYSDVRLLAIARALDSLGPGRARPRRVPALGDEALHADGRMALRADTTESRVSISEVSVARADAGAEIRVRGECSGSDAGEIVVHIDGQPAAVAAVDGGFEAVIRTAEHQKRAPHSAWRSPYQPLVTVLLRTRDSVAAGAWWGPDQAPSLA